jgi:hypothetical protein
MLMSLTAIKIPAIFHMKFRPWRDSVNPRMDLPAFVHAFWLENVDSGQK